MQGGKRVKLLLVTKLMAQSDTQVSAIEIARKIENMYFKLWPLAVYRGTGAHVGHAIMGVAGK